MCLSLWLAGNKNKTKRCPEMIFIVRGPEGQRRVEVDEKRELGPQLCSAFGVEGIGVSLDAENTRVVDQEQTCVSLGLRSGQMLYVEYEKMPSTGEKEEAPDNTIKRERDELVCNHDANAMCSNCAPLDPWDEKYYKDNMIKYLSFGSYCEMMKSRGREVEAEDYSVQTCKEHGANTRCSRCQERDIVLMPQVFRMVDHIEFDDQGLVENFIRNWRESGRQRFGLLVGRYMEYEQVPLGVKAVVSGIWEPDQEDFPDGFVITESMDNLFEGTGMETVGMIYTDIQVERGTTTSNRLARNYFLSSLEIQFVAKMQLMHPYKMCDGSGGRKEFGSRFVTVVVTADGGGNIELQEYQVSGQCMGLVRSDQILPTEDPEKFLTTRDIVYRSRERESMIRASPYLPGDFFLVRLTHGCKQNPLFRNSEFVAKKLTTKKMAEYFQEDFSLERFSNFSLLMKIRGAFVEWKRLFKSVVCGDREEFGRMCNTREFRDFVGEMEKYRPQAWSCQACTFSNEKNMERCEMCGTERAR